METILKIYGVVECVILLLWLMIMINTKPTFSNGENRLAKNWNEGGNILFYSTFVISIIITMVFVKIIIVGGIIDFITK
jgi:hypothetical protein